MDLAPPRRREEAPGAAYLAREGPQGLSPECLTHFGTRASRRSFPPRRGASACVPGERRVHQRKPSPDWLAQFVTWALRLLGEAKRRQDARAWQGRSARPV